MNKAKINLIVAVSLDDVIGIDGDLPWKLKGDLQLFKEMTTGLPIIMGGNTYKSLPRMLPKRDHIVISNTVADKKKGLHVFPTVTAAMAFVNANYAEAFVIGGAQIYTHFLQNDLVDTMYVTEVNTNVTIPADETTEVTQLRWSQIFVRKRFDISIFREQEADADNEFSWVAYKYIRVPR